MTSFVTCNGSCKTCLWLEMVYDLLCVNIVIWGILRWFVTCYMYILWFMCMNLWFLIDMCEFVYICVILWICDLYSIGNSCFCFLWKQKFSSARGGRRKKMLHQNLRRPRKPTKIRVINVGTRGLMKIRVINVGTCGPMKITTRNINIIGSHGRRKKFK